MMAQLIKHCDRHPDRRAIGVCVITHRAICAECSTRYNGVNYSKEGLEEFLKRQQGQITHLGRKGRLSVLFFSLLLPLAVYLVYLSFEQTGQVVVDILQFNINDFK